MKMKQICKCGHEKEMHIHNLHCVYLKSYWCKCKKFEEVQEFKTCRDCERSTGMCCPKHPIIKNETT